MEKRYVKRKIRQVYRSMDGLWHSLDMRLQELESGPENCQLLTELEEKYRTAMTNQTDINLETVKVLALHDNSLDDLSQELNTRLKLHNARTLRLSSTITALMKHLGMQYDANTGTVKPVEPQP